MRVAKERGEWTQDGKNNGVCIVCDNWECFCWQEICLDCHEFLNECECNITEDREKGV